ncbi:MAG TPA: glycine oxidase ThiO [Candidatus Dormibacteraeota bacterium]|nr:glycine oxidase ThiO [Candidatus Dormibacteraeota bacterium]
MARIVIIGGGIIGCAVAERLTRERHHQVLLFERETLGSHASGSAAGLLTPYGEVDATVFDLAARSLALFPEVVERAQRSGIDVEYRSQEVITPALTAEEERRLHRGAGRWLDVREARAEEPGLSHRVRGAAVFPAAQVTPIRLVRALASTAAMQGAEIREGAPVGALSVRGGCVQGVQTADGHVKADVVVLAAGPWSPTLASPLGVALDVRPSRGQLAVLRPLGSVLRRMLTWRSSYLVPKPDGTVVAGSTEEDVGFDDRTTVEGVAGLLEFAIRAVPALGAGAVERVSAALRPMTSDGRPVIGRSSELPNLVMATGHGANGILLAPLTADLVAEHIT